MKHPIYKSIACAALKYLLYLIGRVCVQGFV